MFTKQLILVRPDELYEFKIYQQMISNFTYF